MSESPTIQLQVSANASQAIEVLGKLSSVLEKVKTAVEEGQKLNNYSESINKLGESIRANITEETVSRFERFADAAAKLSSVGGIRLSGLRQASNNVRNNDTMRDLQGRLSDTAGSARVLDSAMRDVQGRIAGTGPAADGAGEKAKSFAGRLRELTATSGKTSIGIVNLFKDFARIAKYRLLRTAIKEITEGFRFGVDNVRAYSKAIGSDFAKDMNSAGAALDTMKNSIGAAVAPVLQMLIPILKTVTNAVIEAVNWLNQLFTLLRGGGTWTRAKALSDPLDEMKKSAKGAGKEVKNLLADWDELNIIQSKGGSGSGASAVELDYADMFEEVDVFDKNIRDLVSWIQEHMETIKTISAAVGAIILGWKISKAFGSALSTIGSLIAGGALVVLGVKLSSSFGKTLGLGKGISTSDLLKAILGPIASAIGGYIMLRPIGLGLGGALIGLTVSIAVMISSYISGYRENILNSRWGDVQLGADKIKQSALGMFDFDISAQIEIIDTVLQNEEDAKNILNGKIDAFNEALHKVKVNVDSSPEAIEALGNSAKGVITQASAWLKESSALLETTAQIVPILGKDKTTGETIDITKDTVGKITELNNELQTGIESLGVQIAEWMDKGTKSGWKNNEAEMIQELSDRLRTITNSAEASAAFGDFFGKSSIALKNLTRDSAKGILDQQVVLINDYASDLRMGLEKSIQNAYAGMKWAQAFADTAKDDVERAHWQTVADEYKAKAEELEAAFETSYAEGIEKAVAPLREKWISALLAVFSQNDLGLAGVQGETLAKTALLTNNENWTEATSEEIAEQFRNGLREAFNHLDPVIVEASEALNFQLFDILPDAEKARLVKTLRDALDSEKFKSVLQLLNWEIPIDSSFDDDTVEQNVTETVEAVQDSVRSIDIPPVQQTVPLWLTYVPQDMGTDGTFDLELDANGDDTAKELCEQIYDEIYDAIKNYHPQVRGSLPAYSFFDNVIEPMIREIGKNNGLSEDTISKISSNFYENWLDALLGDNWTGDSSELLSDLEARIHEAAETVKQTASEEAAKNRNTTVIPMELIPKIEVDAQAAKEVSDNIYEALESFEPEGNKGAALKFWNGTLREMVNALISTNGITGNDAQNLQMRFYKKFMDSLFDDNYEGGFDSPLNILLEEIDDVKVKNIYEEIYDHLANYEPDSDISTNDFWDGVLYPLVKSATDTKGITGDAADEIADMFYDAWIQSLFDKDYDGGFAGALSVLKEMLESPEDWNITPPNTEPLMTGLRTDAQEMNRLGDEMLTAANKVLGAYSLVSSIGMYSFGGGTMRKRFGEDLFKPYNYTFAEGGFPTTGSMFIARESGPELVGRIGNRTAVANNDQIVSGVANGVAAGQAEQNALLRQQNDYLRRILAKESTVKVEPTAEWGRFNQRSEELRARSAGA